VDFGARRDLLRRLDDGVQPPIDADGAVKLLVTSRALRLRRDRPELFTGYTAISATGSAGEHAFAFDRGGAVAVATRLPAGLQLAGGWGDTSMELPPGSWIDLFTETSYTGGAVPVGELLARYPVALLARAAGVGDQTTNQDGSR
jgi:(1->4)-alpha-D-glucan 1-alpha-D-glucosylmutase